MLTPENKDEFIHTLNVDISEYQVLIHKHHREIREFYAVIVFGIICTIAAVIVNGQIHVDRFGCLAGVLWFGIPAFSIFVKKWLIRGYEEQIAYKREILEGKRYPGLLK